ncbi:TerB family tellurite resistance protein [Reichenbachiella agarivorans]|uniref:TerB family tellurite resistance protein n=1 Tax=Reichenbachiella agarivorans TaxID=2979464 RepID=A0ABY6CJN5_9BACT|nr:TerB family tellurite resistance protein [Reichenbachiella agarivorans]UXP30731.1 TerB family tellurite resistance protein [Reichenbachiella agarivorans]
MSNIHLNILIQLAKIDGVIVQQEIDLINEVGKANGLSNEEIREAYEEAVSLDLDNLTGLTDDEKYDVIYSVVQLMKIDGKLYNEEIKYCAKMASRLGYDENVLFELMLKIYADPDLCADKASLKKHIQKYLIS